MTNYQYCERDIVRRLLARGSGRGRARAPAATLVRSVALLAGAALLGLLAPELMLVLLAAALVFSLGVV